MNHSPLIYDYLKKYQEDPRSRVFAPLAEAYRKAGLFKEAVEIAREGLIIHPHFVGGRVALARALFDQGQYAEVVKELESVVENVPDNLVAQRILGESCLMLGRTHEALATYKMLLYFLPQDPEVAKIVQELETQMYSGGGEALIKAPDPVPEGLDEMREHSGPLGGGRSKVERVERLQSLLIKVEQYRLRQA